MLNISLTDLTERREERLEWHSEQEDVQLCIMKGLDEVIRRLVWCSLSQSHISTLGNGVPFEIA